MLHLGLNLIAMVPKANSEYSLVLKMVEHAHQASICYLSEFHNFRTSPQTIYSLPRTNMITILGPCPLQFKPAFIPSTIHSIMSLCNFLVNKIMCLCLLVDPEILDQTHALEFGKDHVRSEYAISQKTFIPTALYRSY